MSGPEQVSPASTEPAPAAPSVPVAETAPAATDATATTAATDATATTAATGPAAPAPSNLMEALQPPKAIEDVAAFVPRPGSPAAEPAVQDAKAEAEAARAAFATEVARLRDAGRDAVDIKAKVKGLPAAIAREPAKFLGLGAAGAGAGIAVSRLRRGRKKVMPPGLLPPEVEAALQGTGTDQEKVRQALNEGFTHYLEAQGAQAKKGRRLPGAITLFVLPVAATATREAIKRAFAGTRKS